MHLHDLTLRVGFSDGVFQETLVRGLYSVGAMVHHAADRILVAWESSGEVPERVEIIADGYWYRDRKLMQSMRPEASAFWLATWLHSVFEELADMEGS